MLLLLFVSCTRGGLSFYLLLEAEACGRTTRNAINCRKRCVYLYLCALVCVRISKVGFVGLRPTTSFIANLFMIY